MARKRLNSKLLIILAGVTAVLALGLFLAARWYLDSPERAVSRAEQYEAQGDWQEASGQWGRDYKRTNNPAHQLRGIQATMHLTTDPVEGDENMRIIAGALHSLVASDPNNLEAVRALMRFFTEDPGFLLPQQPTHATREVRRLAGYVLDQHPDDAEARIYSAAATLNLTGRTGEQIPAEEADKARRLLVETVRTHPLDGTGIMALQRDLAQQVLGFQQALTRQIVAARNQANSQELAQAAHAEFQQKSSEALAEFTTTLEAAASAATNVSPREAMPTDTASLYLHLAKGWEGAAALTGELAKHQLQASQTQSDAGLDADVIREAMAEAAAPVKERAWQQYQNARQAIDDERDVLSEDALNARTHYAEALLERGESEAAETELRNLAADRPWDIRAALRLSQLLRDTNRTAEAAEVMRDLYARRDEPLPEILGVEGARARRFRVLTGLHLADVLLDLHDQTNGSAEKQAVLAEAGSAYDEYETARVATSMEAGVESERVRGQLQLARGDTAQGITTLTSALRRVEELDSSQANRQRLDLLLLLADANRDLRQTGAEIEYLRQVVAVRPALGHVLRLAQRYIDAGRTDEAQRLAEQLLEARPDLAEAQALLARIGGGGESDDAFAAMPEETDRERRFKLSTALGTGRNDEALRLAQIIHAEQPGDARVGTALAQLLAAQGRGDEAVALLDNFPDNPNARLLRQQISGGAESALASIEDPVARLRLRAQLAEQQGELETAITHLEEAAQLEDAGIEISSSLFDLYLQTQRFEEAETVATKLEQQAADGMDGASYDIRLQLARGQTEEALAGATRLTARFEQIAAAEALRAEALRQSNRYDEAVSGYLRAIELAPTNVRNLIGAVASLRDAGRDEETLHLIERGLRLSPGNAYLEAAKVNYDIRYGDPGPIIAARREAVNASPDSAAARLALVQTLGAAAQGALDRGQADQARRHAIEVVEAAEQALADFPQDARFLDFLAVFGPETTDAERQRIADLFEQLMQPSAQQSLIANSRAVRAAVEFYTKRGNVGEAETVIRRHLSATADVPREQQASMLLMLAQVLMSQDKVAQAVSVLDGYEDLPEIRRRKIEMLAGAAVTGRLDNALQQIRDAITDADAEELPATTYTAVALVEMQLGDPERAEAHLDQAARKAPGSAPVLYLQGVLESRKPDADLERAADLLMRADQANPSNIESLRILSQVRLAQGRRADAVQALRTLLERVPDDVPARLSVIRMQLAQSPPDYTGAGRDFRAADGAGVGDNPQLLALRSQMELTRGNDGEAVRYVQQAVRSAESQINSAGADPTAVTMATASYQRALLRTLLRAGQTNAALSRAESLLSPFPQQAGPWWARHARAEALSRLGRTDAARQAYATAFDAARTTSPQAAEQVLVDMSRRIGFDAAYALIRDQVEPAEGTADGELQPLSLVLAGRLYVVAGDVSRAIELMNSARETLRGRGQLTPENERFLDLQVGTLMLSADPPRVNEAIEVFRGALERDPELIAAANNLAYALTLQAEAPDTPSEQALALLHEATEQAELAYEDARQRAGGSGSDVNPNIVDTHSWAHVLLAIHTDDTAGLEAATTRLRDVRGRVEREGEAFPELYYHLGRALQALGRVDEAREAVGAGLELVGRRINATSAGSAENPTRDLASQRRLEALQARLNE